jgi:hypothetical protein
MAALSIAEEELQKQAPPSKQGNSNRARRHRNRRKANPDELDIGCEGLDEAIGGSVASSSDRRDNAGEIDDMARHAARHSKPDGEMDAQGVENYNADLVFGNDDQGHKNSGGNVGSNMQQVEASSVECDAGTSQSRVEQPTTTHAERRQHKERERKGKQRQRKMATTRTTLKEALARVDTTGASLDTLNALDAAIVSAKRILVHLWRFVLYECAVGVIVCKY